jgi:hypothetical protein
MKVITLWQPWASFIALGWKTIETRTHDRFKNLKGETIGIHAGNKWDKDWYELTWEYFSFEQRRYTIDVYDQFEVENSNVKGNIICIATVESAGWLFKKDSQKALINCDPKELGFHRFGLCLSDIINITPIPVKGKQGIWNYEV